MRRSHLCQIAFVIALIALTSCAVAATPGARPSAFMPTMAASPDAPVQASATPVPAVPDAERARAQATLDYINAQVAAATAQAQAQRDALAYEATAQAMSVQATLQALNVERAQGEATAQAQSTRYAATVAAQATELDQRATAQALNYMATRQAVVLANEADDRERAQMMIDSALGCTIVIALIIGVVCGALALYWGKRSVDVRVWRAGVIETRGGTLLYDREAHGFPEPALLPGAVADEAEPDDALEVETARAETPSDAPSAPSAFMYERDGRHTTIRQVPDDPQQRAARHLIQRLLIEAIKINGEKSSIIPGYVKLNKAGGDWSGETWSNAIKLIGYNRTIRKSGKSGGTWIMGKPGTLVDLLRAFNERSILPSLPHLAQNTDEETAPNVGQNVTEQSRTITA